MIDELTERKVVSISLALCLRQLELETARSYWLAASLQNDRALSTQGGVMKWNLEAIPITSGVNQRALALPERCPRCRVLNL